LLKIYLGLLCISKTPIWKWAKRDLKLFTCRFLPPRRSPLSLDMGFNQPSVWDKKLRQFAAASRVIKRHPAALLLLILIIVRVISADVAICTPPLQAGSLLAFYLLWISATNFFKWVVG
jgi:hypothetical protein